MQSEKHNAQDKIRKQVKETILSFYFAFLI